jgi:hypothetical protein
MRDFPMRESFLQFVESLVLLKEDEDEDEIYYYYYLMYYMW